MTRIIEADDDFLMSPKNDFAFKMLFGDERNKDILIAFLNSVLNEELEGIELLNTELKKEHIEDRKGILDVRAVNKKGIQIDIEIQLLKTLFMPERTLYYWSKMYTEQLSSGDEYNKLKKAITINILDFECIPLEKCHSTFHITEDEARLRLTDVLEIHFLEMPKLYKDKNINENDPLTQWMMFLEGKSKEVLEMLAKKNEKIEKAYSILQIMSKDKEARILYNAREAALHDEVTRIKEAKEEGLKEGRIKEKIEVAKNLLLMGMDVLTVIKVTGLSKDDVEEIKDSMH